MLFSGSGTQYLQPKDGVMDSPFSVIHVQVLCEHVFSSSEEIPRSVSAGSYGKSTVSFVRRRLPVFQSVCNILHPQ